MRVDLSAPGTAPHAARRCVRARLARLLRMMTIISCRIIYRHSIFFSGWNPDRFSLSVWVRLIVCELTDNVSVRRLK